MRYLLAILLDGFYAGVMAKGGNPLVIQREKRVLDANHAARDRGIRVGMPVGEAKSILAANGQFLEWEDEPYRNEAIRWLEIIAQFSDVIEPLSQHEALADLSGHPRPRETAEQIHQLLKRRGFAPSLAIAASRWVARLAAKRGDPWGLAYSDPRSYVSDVPTSLLPIATEQAKHLQLLGYRTAADISVIEPKTLRAQFDEAATHIPVIARGRGDSHVDALFPEASLAARFVYEGIPETREALENGLKRITSEIGQSLSQQDRSGKKVELFLEHEDATVTSLARTFARTIATELDLWSALKLMLSEDLDYKVESVRVRMPNLHAARRVQLCAEGGRSRSDAAESVSIAIQHVRGTFGDSAVTLASELPEPRWLKVRRAYKSVNGYLWT